MPLHKFTCIQAVILLTCIYIGVAAEEFNLKPLSDGATSYVIMRKSFHMLPRNLIGLVALRIRHGTHALEFALNKPARSYWVFPLWRRDLAKLPNGFRMYRQGAFAKTPARARYPLEIFYRDFPAGRCKMPQMDTPLYTAINLGFKPLDEMTPEDMVLNVRTANDDDAFKPDEQIEVRLEVDNPTTATQNVRITATLDGRRLPPLTFDAPPRMLTVRKMRLPKLPIGIHWLKLQLLVGDRAIDSRTFPIVVTEEGTRDESISEPLFPIGVYDKTFLSGDEHFLRAYTHAICHSLRKHHLNVIVAGANLSLGCLDVAHKYGIRVVLLADKIHRKQFMTHPAVIAYQFSDEPSLDVARAYRKIYEHLAKEFPTRPVVTCVVGEHAGNQSAFDPLLIWRELRPRLRMVRCYPIRRGYPIPVRYDLMKTHPRFLPFETALRIFGADTSTPWWFVVQTFGTPVADVERSMWLNPTPEQVKAMIHLALAYGAKGILCWSFQTHMFSGGEKMPALVDMKTLAPEDGKYQAVAQVAQFIHKVKRILLKLKPGGPSVFRDREREVIVVGKRDDEGNLYVYAVNINHRNAVTVTMRSFRIRKYQRPDDARFAYAVDVFNGKRIPFKDGSITITIQAGDGRLLRLVR